MAVVSWLSNDNEVTKNKIRDDNIASIELNALSASKTYTVGKSFVLDSDGKLYKATQQIDQGSAIITSGENANCEEVTNGAEGIFGTKQDILNLNSAVGNLASRVGRAEGNITTLNEIKANTSDLGTASTKNAISVVADSSDLVESGAVKDIVGWGNKNLLSLEVIPESSTSVSYTLDDGVITVNGTQAPGFNQIIKQRNPATPKETLYLPKGKYIFSCGGTDEPVFVGTSYNGNYSEWGTGTEVTFEITDETQSDYKLADGSVLVGLWVRISGTYNNTKLYPMIRKYGESATFEPYHASVSDSLDDKVSYADNAKTGVHNVFDIRRFNAKTSNVTYSVTGGSVRVQCDSGPQQWILFDVDLPKNTDFEIITNAVYTSGVGLIVITASNDGSNWTNLKVGNEFTTSGVQEYAFNTGNYNYFQVKLFVTRATSTAGDITYSNILIKYADDTDPTYQPYAQTNRELTVNKCDNSVIGTVEGSSASKAWSVGEHFIKDGQFKEVTQPIASGGAISDSNTVDKPIADCLVKAESACINIPEGVNITTNKLVKFGNVVTLYFIASGITKNAWTTFMNIPEGFRPAYNFKSLDSNNNRVYIMFSDGYVQCSTALDSNSVELHATWVTK